MASWQKVSKWVLSYLNQSPVKSIVVLVTSIVEPMIYMYPLFISADIVGELALGGTLDDVLPYFKILIPLTFIQYPNKWTKIIL